MLTSVLRTASVITLLCCTTACQFGSEPNVGQSSGNNARKKVDAGSADAEAARVSTASGDVRSRDAEADADTKSNEGAAAAGKGGAGGRPSGSTKNNNGGSGGAKSDDPDKDKDNEEAPPPESQEPDPNEGESQEPTAPADAGSAGPADAGTQPAPGDAAVGDAAARPTVDNPFGVLGDLAQRTAGGKTAATIDQFLETLAQGEAPATSINEFLVAIDDEMDCVMNPFATECLAACQAVSTTCAVCVFDETCRTTMLEICGYSALAGCVPRR